MSKTEKKVNTQAASDFDIVDGMLFKYNGSGGRVVIPDGVTEIFDSAFDNCVLESVELPASVTELRTNPFSGCTELTSITVSKDNKVFHSASGCLIHTESKTLVAGSKNCAIPTDGSVTSIGDSAFFGYDLTSISIPSTVTAIGEWAFYSCRNLTSVIIPDSVIEIEKRAFACCTSLPHIAVSKKTEFIGDHAFDGCSSLTDIVIPISVAKTGNCVFADCDGLTDIYCEAETEPDGWNEHWLVGCGAAVHWGHKGGESPAAQQKH